MAIVSDVEIRLRADIARLQQDLNAARRSVDGALGGMSQAVEKFKGLLGGLAVGAIFVKLAGDVIGAQREFDKLNASLITATGSTANAAQAFAALQKFAARTPYDLQQTTEAFLKLRNLGLTPSERALTSYGNTAAAMGKNLMQLVEAVADATTGEFERLKEFGIKAKQNGDTVALTFQGVTTSIKNNAADIEKYLIGLGETKFAGGMQLQAETLDGAISALGDSWQATLRTFAQSGFGDASKQGVLGLTEALGNLQSIMLALAGETKNTKGEVEKFSIVSATLTPIFETIAVLGNEVGFTFRVVGREIAGFAAGITTFVEGVAGAWGGLGTAAKGMFENGYGNSQTVLKGLGQTVDSLKGSFTGMLAISQEITDQSEADRIATEARSAAIIGAAAARKKAAEEEAKDTTDQLERYKVVAQAQTQQTAAQKKAADEALAFYAKTRDASIDQLMQLEAERDGQAALSSEEKKRIEILNDLLKFGKSLTAQQRNDIKGWAESIPVLAKYNAELAKSKALREQRENEAYSDVGGANAQTQALQDQIKYYGLTEEAVLKLKAAEIERGLQGGYIDDIERKRLQGLLAATNDQIEAQTKLTQMKSESTFWSGLEDTAKQTFLSIANGSKDTATRLKETFKNIFFDWLYQMTVKKWLINVSATVSGTAGVPSLASAAGSVGSLLGGASSLAGISGSIGSLTGLASVLGSVGGIATGALQTAGALLTGQIAVGQTLSAGLAALSTGSAAGAVAGLSSLAGVLGPIGLGIAGGVALLNKAFGHGSKTVTGTSITGTLSTAGATASTVNQWEKKGGWFSSTKHGFDSTPFTAAQNTALADTYKAIIDVSKLMGDTVGVNTEKLATRIQQLNVSLTGLKTEAEQLQAVSDFFVGVGNTIAVELVPNLTKFQLEGEALSATLQRVATDYATTDAALAAIGKTVGVVGVAGIEARERLIAAAGGLDTLVSGLSYFQQNSLTEAEQIAPVQAQLAKSLAALGQSGLKTEEQFKAAVLGIDVSTEAGAKLFAQLIALAPAFKTVADYADELAGVVRKSASEIRSERAGLQNQLDQLIMTPAQLAEKARNAIDASNRDLYDQIVAGQARLDRAAALNNEATALQAVVDKGKAWVASLKDANNALAIGSQSPLTPLEKYEEARRQLEATLASARAGNEEAQSNLSSIEQAFLAASQTVNAGDAKYASDYAMVINANKEAIEWAAKQVTIDEQTLTAMQQQVALLTNLTASATTISQLLAGDFSSYTANAGSTAVVEELKGLRAENAALTARVDQLITEQRDQTGAIITATVDSNVTAAQTVVGGVDDSVVKEAWVHNVKAIYE